MMEHQNATPLKGRVVIIVGGAGLLGRALVSDVAAAGATTIIADRDLAAASAVAGGVVASGSAEAVAVDISISESVTAMIASTVARHGRVDAVVNSAYPRNRQYGRRVEDVTYADFNENVGLHLGGYFLVAQQAALYFREHGGGSIINIASVYGTIAPRFEVYDGTPMTMPVEYAAIKAGVLHLTRYFAQYFKTHGVRVNAVSPGGIADGQSEAFVRRYAEKCGTKGMLDPGDVAGAVVFLLSDAARYVTGQNLVVDDGFSL